MWSSAFEFAFFDTAMNFRLKDLVRHSGLPKHTKANLPVCLCITFNPHSQITEVPLIGFAIGS